MSLSTVPGSVMEWVSRASRTMLPRLSRAWRPVWALLVGASMVAVGAGGGIMGACLGPVPVPFRMLPLLR